MTWNLVWIWTKLSSICDIHEMTGNFHENPRHIFYRVFIYLCKFWNVTSIFYFCPGFLLVMLTVRISHGLNSPGTFTSSKVLEFPFYGKLVNPCGFNAGVRNPNASPTRMSGESRTNSVEFLVAMGTGINLTLGSLQNVDESFQV